MDNPIHRYETTPGDHIRDAIAGSLAMAKKRNASVAFDFNSHAMIVHPDHTEEELAELWEKKSGQKVLTKEEERIALEKFIAEGQRQQEEAKKEMEEGHYLTEEEMREAEVPWFKEQDELMGYIRDLVERPHDYGTCVYAMSMAAQAAYHYVASKLGVTGFQASAADLDFLGRTRRMKHGFRIINYENLMYPQYWRGDHRHQAPFFMEILRDPESAERFARLAKERLAGGGSVNPDVADHWRKIASKAWL